ncbi:MAG TPA: maltotransferase domain-containing protein, partial [Candidatus Acidoferrum sp.]|nr:maltotransferase domain-containing protein [Candidatus Acidoferrum sp.]
MPSYQAPTDSRLASSGRRLSHIIIEDVTPSVDGGRYLAKRIVGEPCVVEADIFRDGHQVLRAAVKWRRKQDEVFDEAPMLAVDNDRWRGEFLPTDNTRYVFTIEAWTDLFASWLADFTKKVKAARPVASDVLEGIALVEKMIARANGADRELFEQTLARLRKTNDGATALAAISDARISAAAERVGERSGLTRFDPLLELVVDREKARFGTWYEMFVRSQGREPGKPGTFRDAERRLPELRDLGFDVVYLPPIHPIGHTNRKGPGNALNGGSSSPGSPWAIGSEAGGHTAIDPSIGTLEDFDRFNAAANRLGIEVA